MIIQLQQDARQDAPDFESIIRNVSLPVDNLWSLSLPVEDPPARLKHLLIKARVLKRVLYPNFQQRSSGFLTPVLTVQKSHPAVNFMDIPRGNHLPHLFVQIQVRILHGFVVFRDEALLSGMAGEEGLELLCSDDELAGITKRACLRPRIFRVQ